MIVEQVLTILLFSLTLSFIIIQDHHHECCIPVIHLANSMAFLRCFSFFYLVNTARLAHPV